MQLIISIGILVLYIFCLSRKLLDFDFLGISLGLFSIFVMLINSKIFVSYFSILLVIESHQLTIITLLFGFLFLISLLTAILFNKMKMNQVEQQIQIALLKISLQKNKE